MGIRPIGCFEGGDTMCRLFGFRGAVAGGVNEALVDEENALARQSREHPDGWGVAWYDAGAPQVSRSLDTAHMDDAFHTLAADLRSDTVVAHVRKASVGGLALPNTHPFVHGPWVFAHNGTVPEFAQVRSSVEAALDPDVRARLVGETDSERVFGLFLGALKRRVDPGSPDVPLAAVFEALAETLRALFTMTRACEKEPSLNLLVTNGRVLAASRQGRTLHFSTHSRRCEHEDCRMLRPLCERDGQPARVEHLLVASEPIGADHAWVELEDGDLIGIDAAFRVVRSRVEGLADLPRRMVA